MQIQERCCVLGSDTGGNALVKEGKNIELSGPDIFANFLCLSESCHVGNIMNIIYLCCLI